MSRSRSLPLLALVATLALVLSACADGGGATAEPQDEDTPAPAESEPMETEAGGGAGGSETVTIVDFSFGDDITIAAGTTVTFQNDDSAAHTVTEGADGTAGDGARFDEEVPGSGAVDIPFDEPGEYQITCRFHPTMNFTVTVEG